MNYIFPYESPLGPMTMASDGMALTGLWFDGQAYMPDLSHYQMKSLPIFAETATWLDGYFLGNPPTKLPAIHLNGTTFRLSVWKILQSIPYGQTTTYGQIAKALSPNMSAQAVGGAVGHNPISILVPCHRVLGQDGSLTGYAGGTDRKQFLLTLERP